MAPQPATASYKLIVESTKDIGGFHVIRVS